MHPDWEQAASDLAAQALAEGRPTAWFDRLYAAGVRGDTAMPWDRAAPNPLLVDWVGERPAGSGRAVVVGSGLGRDAEFVGSLGWDTTAFDVSETAIATARQRFPGSPVHYVVADLLTLPPEWSRAFELVVESYTVQALPVRLRERATAAIRDLVAPGGTLMTIYVVREDDAPPPDGPPWPLTRAEVEAYATDGLSVVRLDRDAMRWLAEFRRSTG